MISVCDWRADRCADGCKATVWHQKQGRVRASAVPLWFFSIPKAKSEQARRLRSPAKLYAGCVSKASHIRCNATKRMMVSSSSSAASHPSSRLSYPHAQASCPRLRFRASGGATPPAGPKALSIVSNQCNHSGQGPSALSVAHSEVSNDVFG